MPHPKNLHLFCRVIDNFGDIGVCWRLARQLVAEHSIIVTLWVDDLPSFQKICPAIVPDMPRQHIQGTDIRLWDESADRLEAADIPDVVIEAFACELPPGYVQAMARRALKPVWINLEYLSAESWVESCHKMPSHHPSLQLTKYFFFPGFSNKTGGLLVDPDLARCRERFQSNSQAVSDFFAKIGVSLEAAYKHTISLFCYPNAPVGAFLDKLRLNSQPVLCLVPEGVAAGSIQSFLQKPAKIGASATKGALTVQVLPFLEQFEYDKLLWACDINFVRGEDSFVRAQWAARPFVWHIYPQDGDAHLKKMEAFLRLYKEGFSNADALSSMWNEWNGDREELVHWDAFQKNTPQLLRHAQNWSMNLLKNGDLASNLIQFILKIS